jgi:hypothetical protein
MNVYHIAATVRHSGKYIEEKIAAFSMADAIDIFQEIQNISVEALSELDITETGESE